MTDGEAKHVMPADQGPAVPTSPQRDGASATASMGSIAIVGTEGCGKTVFITTLAQSLRVYDPEKRTALIPDPYTLKYVASAWARLQVGDWPAHTHQGDAFELKWSFLAGGSTRFNLRLLDMAGHDLRYIFTADGAGANANMPDELQPLIEYCRSASIVLFMVNLGDFVGGDSEATADNEAALLSAMNWLQTHDRKCGLILAQADLYVGLVEQEGSWSEVVRKTLPSVYGAHLADGKVPIFPVACVADTVLKPDRDGAMLRKPMSGFHSEGIQEVFDWLRRMMEGIERVKKYRRIRRWILRGLCLAVILAMGVVALKSCSGGPNPRVEAIKRMRQQAKITWSIEFGFFMDDLVVANQSPFPIYDVAVEPRIFHEDGSMVPFSSGVHLPLRANFVGVQSTHKWSSVLSVPGNRVDWEKSSLSWNCSLVHDKYGKFPLYP